MTSDRRERVEAVALEALARDGDARAAYLEAACAGDAALRREVESLVAGQVEAAVLLESPPWAAPAAPPLVPGTRLGPYELDAVIGAGGMGEVYKGRDTRLGRTVAIKVLSPALAGDPERRRRFEQEARAVSALNHPHICPLFDVGEAAPSGPDGLAPSAERPAPGPLHYLVLAHLEGQTLGARLKKGPLPVAHVLDLGAQMADALSAAHKAGIVHRDLKPANVMLTKAPAGANGPSGLQAVLLDFGLAKLTGRGERPALDADGVTASASLTERGMVLGTVPYMAPEQVEGTAADARTDLWALGAVLYEMLTGRRAFEGETPTKVAAAILEHEPAPVTSLQAQTPAALAHVITKCLAKDPDARWDTAHDVAEELRWLREAAGAAAMSMRPASSWHRRVLAVSTVLAAVAGGAALMWLLRPAEPVAPARLSLDVRPADEVNAGGRSGSSWVLTPGGSRTALAWTPDGQALVFVGRRDGVQQLYVRRLTEEQARPLDGTEGAQVPAVSHDGQRVAFWSAGAIRYVPTGGGPVTDLAPGVRTPPWGMAWDDGGRLLFGHIDGCIWQVPPAGSPAAVTTLGDAEIRHALPSPLPGGRTLLYTARRRRLSWGDEQVIAYTLATGERKVLIEDAADARYLPSGYLVFLRRGTLFAVPFDARRLEVQGRAAAVLDNVVQALTSHHGEDVTGAGQFAAASTGSLASIRGPLIPFRDEVLAAVDRRGQATQLLREPRAYWAAVRLSPVARRLAVVVLEPTDTGLWLYDLDRETLTPLARGGETSWAVWSPDGRRLAFPWLKGGRQSLAVQTADGSSAPQPILAGLVSLSSWSPDGRELVGMRANDIVVVTLDGDRPHVRPLFETPEVEDSPALSPDGAWLAYGSDRSGRREVYVRPYPGPGEPAQVSRDGGYSPVWNPAGGNELFFLSLPREGGNGSMLAAEFSGGRSGAGGLRIGRPRTLFTYDPSSLMFTCAPVRCYDVSADGQRFYVRLARPAAPPPPVTHIDLVLDWVEEVKAKVPGS